MSEVIYILIRNGLFNRSDVVGIYSSWTLANKMGQADRAAQKAGGNLFAADLKYTIERKSMEIA